MKKAILITAYVFLVNVVGFSQTRTNKLDSTGNVGVGTTSPIMPLEVKGTIFSSSISNNAGIYITGAGGNYGLLQATDNYNSVGKNLVLQSFGGNVGIGTTAPLKLLHVKGAGAFGNQVTSGNATRALNLTDADAVMRILRVHTTNAPAVELISRTTADGANVAWWDFYAEPSDKSFRIRDRVTGTNFDRLTITGSGSVGIGTINPGTYKLAVEGNIGARKLIVTTNNWADYVFEPSYKLPTLQEVETFIKANRHLPGVPSAKEVEKEGLDVGDNQATLLKKIEELTLYMIDLQKRVESQQKEIAGLKKKLADNSSR